MSCRGGVSLPAVYIAAPNKMALTTVSPRYSTRRSGTAETGIEVWLPTYHPTDQNMTTPSTSAA
jgi:hypothetical protein